MKNNNDVDVRALEFKTAMQFDVWWEYSILIFNVFTDSIQSRMLTDEWSTEDVFMSKAEFWEMLYTIETDNNIKFVKEEWNDNRYVIVENAM